MGLMGKVRLKSNFNPFSLCPGAHARMQPSKKESKPNFFAVDYKKNVGSFGFVWSLDLLGLFGEPHRDKGGMMGPPSVLLLLLGGGR